VKTYLVDTNLVVRFLTGEPEKQAALAARFFQDAEGKKTTLRFCPIVIAEVVFVLTGKIYGFPRKQVAEKLLEFLRNPSFKVQELEVLEKALELFSARKIDFADAYLAATAIVSNYGVVSFDRDFRGIEGLEARILE
jgi:predicted nucleic acid-binding protein